MRFIKLIRICNHNILEFFVVISVFISTTCNSAVSVGWNEVLIILNSLQGALSQQNTLLAQNYLIRYVSVLYKPVPFIYLSWVAPRAPPHIHHRHPPVSWVTGCQLEGAELCLTWKVRGGKVGVGREYGRIKGCVGVADTLTVFFPQYVKDVYSASCQ